MTRRKFDELVERIEARYQGRPAALERSTATWVALGLLGFVSWVTFLLLLGVAFFTGGIVVEPPASLWLLGFGAVLIVYGIMQAGLFLLVDQGLPKGRPLKRSEAPALWRQLDSLGRDLQCQPLSGVFLSMEFNAAVREIPRLGLFGWPRTYLEIGFPLSLAVAPDELRAILAHEFAHLSARHGKSAGRIYRIHRTWAEVFQRMQHPGGGSFGRGSRWATAKFIDWYWPRLRARSFVLSRAQEYQADCIAAEFAGAHTMSSALWRLECLTPWLQDRFWPELYGEAIHRPEPPEVLARMRSAFENPPDPEDADRWTIRGLNRATGNDDTHPSLRDRVSSLGISVEELRMTGFPAPVRLTAADALMGSDCSAIENDLSGEWRNNARAVWRDRHRRATAQARRSAPADVETPPAEAHPAATAVLWESACETAQLQGLAVALPMLREVLSHNPAHAGASVLLGCHLLNEGNPDGESLLWQVIKRADQGWTSQAYKALEDHYCATGQVERLREVRTHHDHHDVEAAEAKLERSRIEPTDTFLHHGLTCEQLEPLRRVLAGQRDCAAAWLVRKKLVHFPERPLFVLCVRSEPQGWGFRKADRERALVRRLIPAVELPGTVLVVGPIDHLRRLARKVMVVADAEVFTGSERE